MPSFLIIGAAKAGTTSLYSYLIQHPQVLGATRKEVQYFSVHFAKGERWYRSHFPLVSKLERCSAAVGEHCLTGEASPYYLFHPHAAERIARALPKVKLIALLRDPVTRAYSHHQFNSRRGKETLPFEEAIEREAERIQKDMATLIVEPSHVSAAHRDHSYLARGNYHDQLRSYYDCFNPSQLLILRSEDLFEETQKVFDEVTDFLALDRWRVADIRPRNVAPLGSRHIPMEEQLREYFRYRNEQLYELIGRDMRW
jgi:hypothetical protein